MRFTYIDAGRHKLEELIASLGMTCCKSMGGGGIGPTAIQPLVEGAI